MQYRIKKRTTEFKTARSNYCLRARIGPTEKKIDFATHVSIKQRLAAATLALRRIQPYSCAVGKKFENAIRTRRLDTSRTNFNK